MYVLIVLVSILSFSVEYISKNEEDAKILSTATYGLVDKISDKVNYKIIIENETKEDNQIFLERLLQLCKDNNYILTTSQLLNSDDSSHKTISYIYDQDNIILNYLNDNLGDNITIKSLEEGYITTDLSDTKADGYLKTTNLNYLDKDIYQYCNFNGFLDKLENVDNSVIYNIYTNNPTAIENQIYKIADGLITYEDISDMEDEATNGLIIKDVYNILTVISIALVVCIINEFLGRRKEIMIAKMLGYSKYEIFNNFFLDLMIKIIGIFVSINILLFGVFVGHFSKSGISFLKVISYNNLLFISSFVVVEVICYLIMINDMKLKKMIDYNKLLNTIFIFKNIVTIFLCIILFNTFVNVGTLAKETALLLGKRKIYEDYYQIENMADNEEAMGILLREKGTLACFYSDGGSYSELPFIIVNENYLDLFLEDVDVKAPALIVPEKYKEEAIDQYKQGIECDITYIKNGYVFKNLSNNSYDNLKDPVILLLNKDTGQVGYSEGHILLSKDKDVSYYRNKVSDYLEDNQIRIVNATELVDSLLKYHTIPTIFKLILYIVVYVIVYLLIIYVYMQLYFNQNKKELAVKKSLGYNFIQRYQSLYLVNLGAYTMPLVVDIVLFKAGIFNMLFTLMFIAVLEMIAVNIIIKRYEHHVIVNILKGSDE